MNVVVWGKLQSVRFAYTIIPGGYFMTFCLGLHTMLTCNDHEGLWEQNVTFMHRNGIFL